MRGPDLGVLLAYAWATYPFTLYTLMSNSNDALVAVLVLAAVWAAGSAPARGAFVALAGLTKFAPLALAPLFATQDGWRPLRKPVLFAAGFAVATALAFAPLLGGTLDLRAFWDHTIAFQAQRGSPFSIWGLYDPDVAWLNYAQRAVQGAGALLAIAVAFLPRRRDVVGLAALSAAVLIALQLGVSHWFYLYIPWFFGLVMIALLGRAGAIEAREAGRRAMSGASAPSWRWPVSRCSSSTRWRRRPGRSRTSPSTTSTSTASTRTCSATGSCRTSTSASSTRRWRRSRSGWPACPAATRRRSPGASACSWRSACSPASSSPRAWPAAGARG